MPQIKEYLQTSDVAGPVRVNAPSQAATQVGRNIENAGVDLMNVGEQINRRAEQTEVSDLGAKIADLQARHTIKFQEAMQKGFQDNQADTSGTTPVNPPDKVGMAEGFLSGLDADMSKLSEGISTRAGRLYFEQQNATLRKEFMELAAHGQAEIAGAKAKTNFLQMQQAQSASLIQNPSGLNASLAMMENTIQTLVQKGGLPAKDAEVMRVQMRQDLAQNAVRGMIQADPEQARRLLASGAYDAYLGGDAKHGLEGEIHHEVAMRRADQEAQDAKAKRELNEKRDQVQAKFLAQIYEGGFSRKNLLHGEGAILDPDKQQTLMAIWKAKQHEPEHPNPAALRQVIERIHLPEGDPRKITTEDQLLSVYTKGGLTWEQLQNGRGELNGKKSIQGQADSAAYNRMLEAAKVALARPDKMGIPDPNGVQNYNSYVSSVAAQIAEARKQGKPIAPLLDPNSKEYLGNQIESYRKSPQQIMQEMMDRMKAQQQKTKSALPPSDPALKPEAIGAMGMDDLMKLKGKVLSPEQQKAAKDRYDALSKGVKN